MAASVNKAYGQIERIYVDAAGCSIRLKNLEPHLIPKGNYFLLQLNHSNYNSLYALVLTAITNGFAIHIRASKDIDPQQESTVMNIVLEFK